MKDSVGKVWESALVSLLLASGFLLTTAQVVLEERLEFSVSEGTPSGSLVGRVRLKPDFSYRLNEKHPWFSFNAQNGEIRTIGELDREALSSDKVDLVIVGASPSYFISVRINVQDLNDNSPRFSYPFQNISIPESVRVGTQIAIGSAQDPDSGLNGQVANYAIVSGNGDSTFQLVGGSQSGEAAILLEIRSELDREAQAVFSLNISAADSGTPPRFGFLTLFINVLDANDNPPLFAQSHYEASVREGLPAGSRVTQVTASDLDTGANGELVYYLGGGTSSPDNAQFEIDSLTGVITTKVPALRCPPRKFCDKGRSDDCAPLCILTVEAVDHGVPAQRGRAFVNVQLIDENDHDPLILFRMYPEGAEVASVDENANIGAVVAVVTVMDEDSGLNGKTSVEIQRGNELGHFVLKSSDPFSLLRVNSKLDPSQVSSYNLTFLATDNGTPPRTSVKYLPIFVRDSSDKPPEFQHSKYEALISERAWIGTYVIGVSVKDDEKGERKDMQYDIVSGNDLGWFRIVKETGLILTAKELDFETATSVQLTIQAKETRVGFASASAVVQIRIEDFNDQVPVFSRPLFSVETPENLPIGSEIYVFEAKDVDKGSNGEIRYLLEESSFAQFFSLNSRSGQLILAQHFNRSLTGPVFEITAIAQDNAWPFHRSSTKLSVKLLGARESPPKFVPTHFFFNVFIGASRGDLVGRVQATDHDDSVKYELLANPGNNIQLKPDTGDIFLATSAALLNGPSLLTIAARSGALPSINNASITVFPLPTVKGNLLPVFTQSDYEFSVVEDSGSNPNEMALGSLSAMDFDSSARVEYSLQGGNIAESFEIGRYSGEVRKMKAIDREAQSAYHLSAVAVGRKGIALVPVTIKITDLNDNTPQFVSEKILNAHAEALIQKSSTIGVPIFFATATDSDEGPNGYIDYSLEGDEDKVFHIDNHTGAITLKVPTFMLPKEYYQLTVHAADRGRPPRTTMFTLDLKFDPQFPPNRVPKYSDYFYAEYIDESTPVNTKIRQLEIPLMQEQLVKFSAKHNSAGGSFAVSPDGWVYVQHPLDYEKEQSYQLNIEAVATSREGGQEISQIRLFFYVKDVNDNSPKCESMALTLRENSSPLTVLGPIAATDADSGLNGKIVYNLLTQTDNFLIDSETGILRSRKSFDRELLLKSAGTTQLSLEVEISDLGSEPRSSKCSVSVEIIDDNDQAPIFSLDMYTGFVTENEEMAGKAILEVTATDGDLGENGEVEYNLKPSVHSSKFVLGSSTGKLSLKKPLDREEWDEYRLEITANDLGHPRQTATTFATISVRDTNDNAPEFREFPQQSLNLSESFRVGSTIASFYATDLDIGANGQIRYEISSGNIGQIFEINPMDGTLRLIKSLDHEKSSAYTLTISARDLGTPPLSSSVPVVMNVLDENDNAPEISGGVSLVGQVMENQPAGSIVMMLTASDADSGVNGRVRFRIKWQKPSNAFEVHSETGVVSTTKPLDREEVDSYSLRIVAEDSPSNPADTLSSERTIAILVTDANDFPPEFIGAKAVTVDATAPAGFTVATIRAKDSDAGLNSSVGFLPFDDGSLNFREASRIFGLNLAGSLFLKTQLTDSKKSIYRLSVQAMDRVDLSGEQRAEAGGLSTRTELSIIVKSGYAAGLRFSSAEYNFDVTEDASIGSRIGQVSAFLDESNRIEYYVTKMGSAEFPVDVDRESGTLSIVQKLDRETMGDQMVLEVYAVDVLAHGARSIGCKVKITIIDVNDEPPKVAASSLQMTVAENAPVGHLIGKLKVEDPDLSGVFSFTILSTSVPFSIDSQSGELRVRSVLDREAVDEYRVQIAISDGVNKAEEELEIDVTDWNDNAPAFLDADFFEGQATFTFHVLENSLRNSFVGMVQAKDKDRGLNADVEYGLLPPDSTKSIFNVNPSTGVITVSGHLDQETQLYILTVEAKDRGNPPLSSIATVFVNIVDLNDNPPEFEATQHENEVSEDAAVGTNLLHLTAKDADLESNPKFTIVSGDPFRLFGVHENGTLFLVKTLDRETTPQHRLTVKVFEDSDRAELSSASRTLISVTVTDVNDNAPKFISQEVAAVSEDSPLGTVVLIMSAQDLDNGLNASVEFHMDPSTAGTFSVDPVLGWVRVNKPLDREIIDEYHLSIWAEDRGVPQQRTLSNITIKVLDANDNPPFFINRSLELSVSENTPVGTSLVQLMSSDKDIGENAAVYFWIESGDPNQQFTVSSGIIFVSKPLDYESVRDYNLSIGMANLVDHSVQDHCVVQIHIQDINDNAPFFPVNPSLIEVAENIPQPLPAMIGRPEALDPDPGLNGKLSYSIIQGNTSLFSIDSMSGALFVTTNLDREFKDNYELLIHVSDAGTPRQTATGTVLVHILDSNDNAPEFNQPYYRGTIEENAAIGSVVTKLEAVDRDSAVNAQIIYSLQDHHLLPFAIDPATGIITTTKELDREEQQSYTLVAQATDSGAGKPLSSIVEVQIEVSDQNDNRPILDIPSEMYVPDNLVPGDMVFPLEAFDADSEYVELVFSLSGTDARYFRINEELQTVETTVIINRKDTYSLTMKVQDSKQSSSAPVRIILKSPHDFPVFKGADSVQSFTVSEAQTDVELVSLQARSPKDPPSNQITFEIAAGNSKGGFWIDPTTGKLSTSKRLDRENGDRYDLWIRAKDNSDSVQLSSFARVQVTVTDENDNKPIFSQEIYSAKVLENQYPPVRIVTVEAVDKDFGENSKITYSIIDGNAEDSFEIDSSTGAVSTKKSLDREKISKFELKVQAKDNGTPAKTSTTLVRISVTDQNDNSPRFTRLFTAQVQEEAAVGTFVVQVTSSDADSEEFSNNTYYFSSNPSGNFAIDPTTGNVTVNGSLDREAQSVHQLKVVAQDGSWRVETSLTIEILDINDNAPLFSEPKHYRFDISEQAPALALVGRVMAIDPDDGVNAELSYSFESKSDSFRINSLTGDIVALKKLFYNEGGMSKNTQLLKVIASDNGQLKKSTKIPVIIAVRKLNNQAPAFENPPRIIPVATTAAPGTTVVKITASDPDAEEAERDVTYNMIGDRSIQRIFQINSTTGQISALSKVGSVGTSYQMKITAEDNGFPRKTSTIATEIIVTEPNANAPKFEKDAYEAILDEGSMDILQVSAVDKDTGLNGEVLYRFNNPADPFLINPVTGKITRKGTVSMPEYTLEVIAEDQGNPSKKSIVPISIRSKKTIDTSRFYVTIAENAQPGTRIYDLPLGVSYRMLKESENFKLIGETISLTPQAKLDYEKETEYTLNLGILDATGKVSKTADLKIEITGVNEFPPRFLKKTYNFRIANTAKSGTIVGYLDAVDEDAGSDRDMFFLIEEDHKDGPFVVGLTSGKITYRKSALERLGPKTTFRVLVKNQDASPGTVDWCTVTVEMDPNARPLTDLKPEYQASIEEHSRIGTKILTLAEDSFDPETKYTFVKGNENGAFAISSGSGTISVASQLDRDSYKLKVLAKTLGNNPQETKVSIRIVGQRDAGPAIPKQGQTGKIMEGDPVGTSIIHLQPIGNAPSYRYRILNRDFVSKFDLDEYSGILTSKSVFDREEKSDYDLQVEVIDPRSPPKSATSQIRIVVQDINDMPSTQETLNVNYLNHGSLIAPGIIGDVHPNDPDIFGSYRCAFHGQTKSSFSFEPSTCMLKLGNSISPGIQKLSIKGTDGVHDWIQYEVDLHIVGITDDQLVNAIFIELAIKDSEILGSFLPLLKKISNEENAGNPNLLSVVSEDSGRQIIAVSLSKTPGVAVPGNEVYQQFQRWLPKIQKNDIISITHDLCAAEPCKNEAKCQVNTRVERNDRRELRGDTEILIYSPIFRSYTCDCGPSFGGKHCEIKVDHCDKSPCSNGGTCQEGPDSRPVCVCPIEFEGQFCEKDRNECSHHSANGKTGPCANGGFCENRVGGYKCICLVGFTGDNCEVPVDHCNPSPCLNNGKCVKRSEGFECSCRIGFSGLYCEVQSFGFGEDSYVELPPLESHENLLTMEFATTLPSGLLLYSYNIKEGSMDYVALDILDGKLRLSAQLERQGQMNLMIPRRVDDGKWYQVQIEHRVQKVGITLVQCSESGSECETCQLSDASCRMTAYLPGVAEIMVPGPSVFLGGVKHYSDLFTRPGQVSSFAFVGCIRGFELNGKTLSTVGIKSKRNLLDYCPRAQIGPCQGQLDSTCGSGALQCIDRWDSSQCVCRDRTVAQNCDRANKPMGFNGGFIHYELSKLFWRKLLFRPVDGKTLVVSDDLIAARKRRSAQPKALSMVPDAHIELDFRTSTTEGLLFFAASGEDSFSLIDIINGTVRYSSKLGGNGSAIEVKLDNVPNLVDGEWHRLRFSVINNGKEVTISVDEMRKDIGVKGAVHVFLGSRLINMSIGGLYSEDTRTPLVKVSGVDIPPFYGCMRRFVLNGQAQPPWNDQSEFLVDRHVGEIKENGCVACVSPPCSSQPYKPKLGVTEWVIICIVLLLAIIVLFAIGWFFKRRRDRAAKLPSSHEKVQTRLSVVAHTGLDPHLSFSNRETMKRDSVHSNSNLFTPLQHTQSRHTMSSRLSGGSGLEQQSNFVYQFPPLEGAAYTNGLDTTADEAAERYDLDNASSIAPSDIEVSHHYRDFRHHNNQPRATPPYPSQRTSILSTPAQEYRNSPSSVKQLKAALRASPATFESSEDFTSKNRSRPGSTHSRRSRKRKDRDANSSSSRPRSRSRRSSSKGSLRDIRKYQSNPTFQEDSTSSESEEQTPKRVPKHTLSPKILSRSPHAPPKGETSTERSSEDIPGFSSDLDLDKLRKPRTFLGLPDETETESEAGGLVDPVPSSLAAFRPPRTIFPLSEDDSDIPSAFLPPPEPPPRKKPLSSISSAGSPWFSEDPAKALRHRPTPSNNIDLEAYV